MSKLFFVSTMLFFSVALLAQRGDVVEGSWKSLKSITEFDLEFDYSNVQIRDFDSEEAYVAETVKTKEIDKKGSGEAWKKRWYEDRELYFEPRFITLFNKQGYYKATKDNDAANYIMKVITTRHYNGWNAGLIRNPARIDATISIYKKGKTDPLFSATYENVRGTDASGYDFDSHKRVAESYAKLAKCFLKELKRKSK